MPTADEAQVFTDYFAVEAAPIWKALALARWNMATTGKSRYKEELVALRKREHELYEDEGDWEQVQAFYAARHGFDNPVLVRQIEVVHRTFLNNQSSAEENAALAALEADVQELFYNHRATVNGRTVSDNEIIAILQNETDEGVRRAAWEGSKEVGARAAQQIRELAHRRNAIAQRLGFRDHYAFALARQEIDEVTLFTLFEQLAEATTPAFTQAKEELDARLRARFGLTDRPELQPWHYADPFFQEVPPVYDADLNEMFAGVDVAALSAKAYEGMGLDVADILERSDLYERERKNQHGFCIRIDREADTRILCNLRPDIRWMTTQMHELGHAVYNKYLPRELPFLLRTPAHTNSTEAIAMLMGRLTRNPEWLVQVAGRDAEAVGRVEAELARETAVGQLIFVRWVLVMLHFEQALYADPDRQDLNELWWELVQRYQQVTPPAGRDAPDWAAKYHIALAPVYYHNYVLGELTASQLERWIGRTVGGVVDNPAAGALLVDRFFAHGARYMWDELVEVATGEPLNPDYFVAQYVGGPAPQ
ncbi:MAG: M2 family metallopeptidase [Anaerolineae bacterium]|nr:M2 family metallopeptidase [Anaerolineae bacterium]